MEDEDAQFARRFLPGENALQQKTLCLQDMSGDRLEDSAVVSGSEMSTATGSLVIRPEQFRQIGMSLYVERMRSYLNEVFPESREVPKDAMGEMIVELTDRAAGYKLVLETHVAPFIVGAWIFGMSFDEDFLTVKEVLEDYEMDCGRKAQWLWDFIDVTLGILEDGMQKQQ